MTIWNWITGLFDYGGGISGESSTHHTHINPASGLPMAGGVDIAGNPFGTNHQHHSGYLSSHDSWSSSSSPSQHNSSSGWPHDW